MSPFSRQKLSSSQTITGCTHRRRRPDAHQCKHQCWGLRAALLCGTKQTRITDLQCNAQKFQSNKLIWLSKGQFGVYWSGHWCPSGYYSHSSFCHKEEKEIISTPVVCPHWDNCHSTLRTHQEQNIFCTMYKHLTTTKSSTGDLFYYIQVTPDRLSSQYLQTVLLMMPSRLPETSTTSHPKAHFGCLGTGLKSWTQEKKIALRTVDSGTRSLRTVRTCTLWERHHCI